MPEHPKTLARRAALRALIASERDDFVLSDFSHVESGVRSFAREIYSNTLRHRARLDWTLAPLLKKPLEKLDAPVREALRLALYEKVALRTPDRAIASEYAGLMRGEKVGSATAFVNAIARRLPDQWRPTDDLAIRYSHPQWLVERYLLRFGREETEKLLRANNQVAPLCLRVNTLKTTREALLEQLPNAHAGKWSPDAFVLEKGDPPSLTPWQHGEIIAQDEAAQLVSLLAAPRPGEFVVDAASAPGGKTTHLAQLMQNQGRILAIDSAPPRLNLVTENAARLGISIIETRAGDFRTLAQELESRNQRADVVLLDAPCLGTGTLRRRPNAKWRKTPAQLHQLLELQSELLDSAARVVKQGGTLVYSTCSVECEENEEQIERFLTRFPHFHVKKADAASEIATESGFLNAFPHRHGTDGMFAARLERE